MIACWLHSCMCKMLVHRDITCTMNCKLNLAISQPGLPNYLGQCLTNRCDNSIELFLKRGSYVWFSITFWKFVQCMYILPCHMRCARSSVQQIPASTWHTPFAGSMSSSTRHFPAYAMCWVNAQQYPTFSSICCVLGQRPAVPDIFQHMQCASSTRHWDLGGIWLNPDLFQHMQCAGSLVHQQIPASTRHTPFCWVNAQQLPAVPNIVAWAVGPSSGIPRNSFLMALLWPRGGLHCQRDCTTPTSRARRGLGSHCRNLLILTWGRCCRWKGKSVTHSMPITISTGINWHGCWRNVSVFIALLWSDNSFHVISK